MMELEQLGGTGRNNRLTKNDILNYLKNRLTSSVKLEEKLITPQLTAIPSLETKTEVKMGDGVEIIRKATLRQVYPEELDGFQHLR